MAKKIKQRSSAPAVTAPEIAQPMKKFQAMSWLFLILIVALILRATFLTEVSGSPFAVPRLFDQAIYVTWAEGIVNGNWEEMNRPYWQGPLYPYMAALIFGIFGKSILAIRIMQILFGLAIIAGVFLLTRVLFDEATALIAAFLTAIFRTFIFMESAVLTETLLALLSLFALLAVLHASRKTNHLLWFAAGFAIGVASVGRGTALLLLPLTLCWIFLKDRKRPTAEPRPSPVQKSSAQGGSNARGKSRSPGAEGKRRSRRSPGAIWLHAALLAGGTLIAIAPVTIRNIVVSHEFVLLSANAGLNLFIGNHPGANGTYDLPPGLDTQSDPRGEAYAQTAAQRKLSPNELSRFYSARARGFFMEEPGSFMALLARKLLLFSHAAEISHDDDFGYFRRTSFLMKLPLLSFGLLFPLTVIGFVMAFKTINGASGGKTVLQERAFAGLVLAISVSSAVIFFIALRYRIPSIPLMIPFAAFALAEGWNRFKARNWKSLSWIIVPFLFLLAVVHLPYRPVKELVLLSRLQSRNQTSLVFQEMGEMRKAIDELQAAIALAPENSSLRLNMGNALMKMGDRTNAEKEYREAIGLNPSNFNAHNNLGTLLEERGDLEDAEKEYMQALSINPGHPLARRNLQDLRTRRSSPVRNQDAEKSIHVNENP